MASARVLAPPIVSRRRPRALLVTVAGVALAIALASVAARGNSSVLPIVVAIVAALVAIRWPRAAVAIVLFGVYQLPDRYLPFSFAGLRSDLIEVVAFGLFALALVPTLGLWSRARPLRGPMLGLDGALAFGAAVAASNGADRAAVVGPLKTLALYLLAVPMIALLGDADGRAFLETWIHRLCCLGGVITLAVAATGGSLAGEGADDVVTLGAASAAQRLRPSVLSLMFLATVLVVHELALRGATPSRVARLALYVVVQLISFNRSSWVPLVLAVLLFAVLRPGLRRPLRGLAALLVAVAIGAVGLALATAGALGPTASAIALRAQSVAQPSVFEENSYQLRQQEDDKAWAAIREDPIAGVGLGRPYGNQIRVPAAAPGGRVTEESLLLHNSFLKTWLWLGLPGVLAFAWLGRRIAQLMGEARRRLPNWEGTRVVAAGAALFGLALRSLFQTSLTSRSTIFCVACALVLVVGGRDQEVVDA